MTPIDRLRAAHEKAAKGWWAGVPRTIVDDLPVVLELAELALRIVELDASDAACDGPLIPVCGACDPCQANEAAHRVRAIRSENGWWTT